MSWDSRSVAAMSWNRPSKRSPCTPRMASGHTPRGNWRAAGGPASWECSKTSQHAAPQGLCAGYLYGDVHCIMRTTSGMVRRSAWPLRRAAADRPRPPRACRRPCSRSRSQYCANLTTSRPTIGCTIKETGRTEPQHAGAAPGGTLVQDGPLGPGPAGAAARRGELRRPAPRQPSQGRREALAGLRLPERHQRYAQAAAPLARRRQAAEAVLLPDRGRRDGHIPCRNPNGR